MMQLYKNQRLIKIGRFQAIWSRSKRPRFFHRLDTERLKLWDFGPIRIVRFKFNR